LGLAKILNLSESEHFLPTAMVAATTAQAKLAGQWIERSEQTRKQPDEMSDAEIAAILRGNPN
jgi:hypothetical protein